VVRRVLFSAPFVVITSCERPIERRVVEAPHDAAVAANPVPRELVAELPPLEPTLEERCRTSRCTHNPPRPGTVPPPPEPVTSWRISVVALARTETGTRVRFTRHDARIDPSWRAVFVTRDHVEVADGECEIAGWSDHQVDCTTRLPPERLADHGRTFRLWVEPPAALVAQVDRERATWNQGPPTTTIAPIRARLLDRRMVGAEVELVVGAGSDRGIQIGWRARLVRDEVPISNGSCRIVRVDRASLVCRTKLTLDQVAGLALLLEAP
jgi:hypothetical protein